MNDPTEPCPVCGVPGQVCVGSAPPPHHIIGAGIFPSLGHEDIFLVEEDVWEDRVVIAHEVEEPEPGQLRRMPSPTVTKVLVARKGDALRMSDARRMGLLNP